MNDTDTSSYKVYSQMLTNENIKVVRSRDVETANYDMESHCITLPVYSFLGPRENQLFVAHEIGHAKFSKYSLEEVDHYFNKFGSLFNVVEDIYIESAMKREYPGLVNLFNGAYATFYAENIFGTDGVDINQLNFASRLNLFFKIGHCVNIKFTPEECAIIVKCRDLHSNSDVIALCEEIYDKFMCTNKKKEIIPQEISINVEVNDQSDTKDTTNKDTTDIDTENSAESTSQEQRGEQENKEESESSNEEDTAMIGTDTEKPENFEQSDIGDNISESQEDAEKEEEDITSKFKRQLKEREEEYRRKMREASKTNSYNNGFWHVGCDVDIYTSNNPLNSLCSDWTSRLSTIHNFLMTNKEYLKAAMLDTFEDTMKHELDLYKRLSHEGDSYFQMLKNAKKARDIHYKQSGRIDTRRLAKYKTTDSIFKLRKLKDKELNHGVVLLVDYSGSMIYNIDETIAQTIIICEFCKSNNIKFEVYLFGATEQYKGETSSHAICKIADTNTYKAEYLYMLTTDVYKIFFNTYHISQLLKNVMSDEKLKEFYQNLIGFGNTPLLEASIVTWHAVKAMKASGIDKTHCILISDGDATKPEVINITFQPNSMDSECIFRDEIYRRSKLDTNDILMCYPSNTTPSTIRINDMPYTCSSKALFIDSIITTVFQNIRDMFDTDITFSYIYSPNTFNGDSRYVFKYVLDDKYREQFYGNDAGVFVLPTKTSPYNSFILYKKLKSSTIAQRNKIINSAKTTKNTIKNKLKIMNEQKKIYEIFITELAKNIA